MLADATDLRVGDLMTIDPVVVAVEIRSRNSTERSAVAAFDTRVHWPRRLSGSAADGIAARLQAAGGSLVAPPESFIVTMTPEIEPGELARARAWGAPLPRHVDAASRIPTHAASSASRSQGGTSHAHRNHPNS
jgi:hypothetical protein